MDRENDKITKEKPEPCNSDHQPKRYRSFSSYYNATVNNSPDNSNTTLNKKNENVLTCNKIYLNDIDVQNIEYSGNCEDKYSDDAFQQNAYPLNKDEYNLNNAENLMNENDKENTYSYEMNCDSNLNLYSLDNSGVEKRVYESHANISNDIIKSSEPLYSTLKKRKHSDRKKRASYNMDFLKDYVNIDFFKQRPKEELNEKLSSTFTSGRLSQVFCGESMADALELAVEQKCKFDTILNDDLPLSVTSECDEPPNKPKVLALSPNRTWEMKDHGMNSPPSSGPGLRTSLNNLVEEYCGDVQLPSPWTSYPDENLKTASERTHQEGLKKVGFFERMLIEERNDRNLPSRGVIEDETPLEDISFSDDEREIQRLLLDYDVPRSSLSRLR